ncbi:MAG: HAD-IA family hydrolase [Candidatus Methanofastidiosia archaeon]|jgi:FMN phosphatase YigB (HAD superfamily)
MIKAVIFDLGGVIIDITPFISEVNQVFQPVNKEAFWEKINAETISLCKGDGRLIDFWKRLADTMGKDIPHTVLKNLWIAQNPWDFVNQDVYKIITVLQPVYKLAIISNTIQEHTKINRKKGLFTLFDVVILSHEVKLTKHNTDIFVKAAKALHVSPQKCIFIDDIPQFVGVAESVGMKGILFKNAHQLESALEEFHVL